MKNFTVKLITVIVPFVALFLVLFRVAYVTELNLLKKDLIFPPGIRAAVIGDSRVEVYFDPNEIPWLINCGQSATPFAITAQKAKLIAELNPGLELIIVDIWPDQFFRAKDKPFEASCPNGISLIEIMTRESMPPLGDNFHLRLSQGLLKPGLNHALYRQRNVKSQIVGGFKKNHKFLKSNKWARVETYTRHPQYELKTTPTGGEQILEDLLVWMQSHNRKVILTSTPLYHLWWENHYSLEARSYFDWRMTEISEKYNVHWYNWLHEYQEEIDFWADGDHLNDIGAKQFSRDKKPIIESEFDE